MTDRKIMQQALEALKLIDSDITWLEPSPTRKVVRKAITALRERLAQTEQEPVAWVTGWHDGHCVIRATNPSAILPIGIALYTAPQPETVIDKSAARRIATALGWVPPGDTSQERVDEAENQRQEQEPVAWLYRDSWGTMKLSQIMPPPVGAFPVYITSQRREWQGLTDDEFRKAVDGLEDLEDCWVALEHALKEKNT